MKAYDSYSEVEMTDCTITFGVMHGDGKWTYWSDTGWEFDVTKECKIEFVEAFDHNGDPCTPPQSVIDEAMEIADRVHWDNLMEGNL